MMKRKKSKTTIEQELMDVFSSALAEHLDAQFPKKESNERGEALVLFAWAATLARNAIREALHD